MSESTINHVQESTTIYAGGTHIQAHQLEFNQYNYQGSEAAEEDELLIRVAASALYDTAEIEDPAKVHPGTREAVRRRLFGALDGRSADPAKPYVWLHGAAGVGKSAIARTLCEQLHAEGQLLASFFFFRASPERGTAARLISTLTFQFRAIIPQLRPHIKRYIRANPLIFTQSLHSQAHNLLINPICQLHKEGKLPTLPQTAIIIDGLDECEGAGNRQDVLKVLHTLKSNLPFPITILVASRPNREIDAVFKDPPFDGHTIEEPLNNERDVDADILKFYTDSFAKIEKFHVRSPYFTRVDGAWPPRATLQLLIKKTSGQFIFAKTVIRFVESDTSDPDERLQMVLGALPAFDHRPFEQLDAIYKVILSVIEPDQLQIALTIIGLTLCDYDPSGYTPSAIMMFDFPKTPTPLHASGFVEWILGLKAGQCPQYLVGLEALLTMDPFGEMQIFHKSFADFLFDPSRSGQFYIAPDLLYERTLRSFIEHHFYHPAMAAQAFILANMQFLLSNARITPELVSGIELVDFIRSDSVVQRSLEQPSGWGGFNWLRVCDRFLRWLIDSDVPHKDRLVVPLAASLQILATKRFTPYLDNAALWPLLYIATRNDLPKPHRKLLLSLVPYIPQELLSLEQTAGLHFSIGNPSRLDEILFVLYETEGPLLQAARAALPAHQSPDGYMVTLLLELVGQCIKGAIQPSMLDSSMFLRNTLPITDANITLSSKLGAFLAMFEEQLDEVTIAEIRNYIKVTERQHKPVELSLAEQTLWNSDDPNAILHNLTEDWSHLEELVEPELVLPDTPESPPPPVVRQSAWLPLLLYPIPIVIPILAHALRRSL